jgi:molybdopterin-containing oxidoreductase family iron-sulfur binding subunit
MANGDKPGENPRPVEEVLEPMTRRTFLKGSAASLVGMAGVVAALQPLLELEAGDISIDQLLQKHYKKLSPEDIQRIMRELEKDCKRDFGTRPQMHDLKAGEGIEFAYALNLSACVGCRKCAHACLAENNQSRETPDDINMSYIRVLEMDKGAINVEQSDQYYDPETVPKKDKYYMPVQCHQCRSAPCVKACPIEATWQEKDGVVVVDYNWCIGCRYCMAACPYDARRFNYKKPKLDASQVNTNQNYLSNRVRPKGVVEKCTFCLQRTRAGRLPACLEVCPTGARIFGNILDPESEINYVLQHKRVYVLKEDVGTRPRFYYFFD